MYALLAVIFLLIIDIFQQHKANAQKRKFEYLAGITTARSSVVTRNG